MSFDDFRNDRGTHDSDAFNSTAFNSDAFDAAGSFRDHAEPQHEPMQAADTTTPTNTDATDAADAAGAFEATDPTNTASAIDPTNTTNTTNAAGATSAFEAINAAGAFDAAAGYFDDEPGSDDTLATPTPTPTPASTPTPTPTPAPAPADGERLAAACGLDAGFALGDALLGIDATALSADEAVTFAQEWERVVAFAVAGREQARADVNTVLVAHFRAEDARYAEMARIDNEQRVAAGLPAIPAGLTAGRGAGFVPPELAALNELGAALRMHPRTIDDAIAHARELAGPGPRAATEPGDESSTDETTGDDPTAGADGAGDGAGRLGAPWAPLLAAMRAGDLTEQHVKAIARWLPFLPAGGNPTQRVAYVQQCADILDVVIPYARTHTPGEAGRRTKTLVLTADPAGARERRRKDAEHRHGVTLAPTEPGTCELVATMPLAHGEAIMSAVNHLAKDARFETAPGCITTGQRQVAALATLILGDPGTITRITGPVTEAKIKATISVVVPLATITAARAALGIARPTTNRATRRRTNRDGNTTSTTNVPGAARTNGQTGAGPAGGRDEASAFNPSSAVDTLPGGRIGTEPVPADLIRDVLADAAADSTIRRLVTDETGTVVDIGRAHYTPTSLQQRLVRLRDGVCRFPGCTRRAEHCEIDHATAWDAGGPTDLANLGALCKMHHQMKTHGRWAITQSDRTGHCTWQSPLGRIYNHNPEPLVPPANTRAPDPPANTHADDKPPF